MSADGYFYDDLEPGFAFPVPPGVTIDAGLAATYRAVAGDALPLSLSTPLTLAVTGSKRRLVNRALGMHLSIGASTVATRNVVANLLYRNVVLHRPVFEGETPTTTTSVAAMSDARPMPGTAPRGKALLSISSASGAGPVLDYERCPLLPCRGTELPGQNDDFGDTALLGWVECNHVGPVFEGDTLEFAHKLESSEAVVGGRVLFIRTTVDAHRASGPGTSKTEGRQVLDWRSAVNAI